MNYEFFIAKRIIGSKSYKSSVSAPIIKIGIAAIAIGMIVMLIAIATGLGLQKKVREKVVAFNGHITISNYDSNVSNESIIPILRDQGFYPEFKAVEGIQHIQGVATKFGVIRTESDFEGLAFKGVGSDYNWTYVEEFLVTGSLPSYEGKLSNEVLISNYLANRLQFEVGDSFEMLFGKETIEQLPFQRRFKVVGIFNSGFNDIDKNFLIGDLSHIIRMNKWEDNQIGNFEVFLEDFSQLRQKEQEIRQHTPSLLNTQNIEEKYRTTFEWIKIFDNNTYGIIAIMIIVAGINMITALLVLILERTHMIGVLKALGSSNWSIRKVFLYNASYLVGLGLLWGNLIGITLLFIQQFFGLLKFPDPEQYYVSVIPVHIGLDYIILLNIGTFIACLLMLMIPSIIITKISPVKAIRFE
ncbi:ABC transporter permease [Psychroserpens sp.]|uniref:ABC transporter permease n=1 Tax=Psychroserpens sp. TaxID=2020870 RepID=UPI001B0ECF6F|nr:FtsX-like permease family protein [Psychroserpens sp.]MBO6606161.1 ABC transporter permease [Psychroserpens sp.]MBO6632338.1 ABC transporter permease [Psychroserpens sp.]MBO6652467.1 ABC transporter permease [Psychroserpens sp.]MBO6681761.1 ABC transporter permease [Psychroserpens sp.]MBO6749536.1 ABC transporter permease [Psychroserpens sp.]